MKEIGPGSLLRLAVTALLLAGLNACGNNEVVEICDKRQAYQSVVPGKRIEVPEGLDPLDARKEMPIPEAQAEQQEPPAGKCIESPPSVR